MPTQQSIAEYIVLTMTAPNSHELKQCSALGPDSAACFYTDVNFLPSTQTCWLQVSLVGACLGV